MLLKPPGPAKGQMNFLLESSVNPDSWITFLYFICTASQRMALHFPNSVHFVLQAVLFPQIDKIHPFTEQ